MVAIGQMVLLSNVVLFLTFWVLPSGTGAPVVWKWFVSRSIPTGSTSSNGTLIPMPIHSLCSLVVLHARRVIAPWWVSSIVGCLVRSSRRTNQVPMSRRYSETIRARKPDSVLWFLPVLFISICSNGVIGHLTHDSLCGVLRFLLCSTINSKPGSEDMGSSRIVVEPTGLVRKWSTKKQGKDWHRCVYPIRSVRSGRVEQLAEQVNSHQPLGVPEASLVARTPYRLLVVVATAPAPMLISHGGVCLFMLGVDLSFDLPFAII